MCDIKSGSLEVASYVGDGIVLEVVIGMGK